MILFQSLTILYYVSKCNELSYNITIYWFGAETLDQHQHCPTSVSGLKNALLEERSKGPINTASTEELKLL